MSQELLNLTAIKIRKLLKAKEVSPLDLLETLEKRISLVDGQVNALPTLCFERARDHAKALMKRPMSERGLLKGLPVPIKDLTEVRGVRTTFGSPIFAQNIPKTSDYLVENLETQGGIVYAKSNTPEFGAGGQTFNEVFGRTLNPWNMKLTCAGSSGGAAVALKTGTAWLAHGSDMGGSLRNPASFCGIVGLRPSVGRVATNHAPLSSANLGQQGPMAKTVEDCALLFDAMCGQDARDPLSRAAPTKSFRQALKSNWKPKRVAFSATLGITPVDKEIETLTRQAAFRFKEMGVEVVEAHPDFSGLHEAFGVMRSYYFAVSKAKLLQEHRDRLKPDVIWNIEKGLCLTMEELTKAEETRSLLLQRCLEFYAQYDLLLSPATIVAAFPVEQRFVDEVNGEKLPDYVRWLAIAYAHTFVYSPALSLPCGFTQDGRPVGLQISAKPFGEKKILKGASLLEEIYDLKTQRIIDPR